MNRLKITVLRGRIPAGLKVDLHCCMVLSRHIAREAWRKPTHNAGNPQGTALPCIFSEICLLHHWLLMIPMKQMNNKETTDEIIQETRRIKEALAKSMDFDIDRILKDARLRQRKSGRNILSPPVQPIG